MSDLAGKQCVPCEGGVPPLSNSQQQSLLQQLDGWQVIDQHHLLKRFKFGDFLGALAFTNSIGVLAEEAGHHPDLHLKWGEVGVEIWTHKIDGLTESDFILAAKIDELAR